MAVAGGVIAVRLWKTKKESNPYWWRIPLDQIDVKAHKSLALSRRSMRSSMTLATMTTSAQLSAQMVGLFGLYNENMVGLIDVADHRLQPNKDLVDQLLTIKKTEHSNLQRFIGIALDDSNTCIYIVGEMCVKGSLTNVIENPVLKLDWFFKNLMIRDLVRGMEYLHSTPITSHGGLTSNTCLFDNRFTLKISGYGLSYFRRKKDLLPPDPTDYERDWDHLLWRAPELLRQPMPPKGTPRGDVYSFAIILQQIILRSGPYEMPDDFNSEMESPREIVME
ncbi:atrial natriuretic peptide receptor 2-like, partial [Paramacrobiotus metropolitanus]